MANIKFEIFRNRKKFNIINWLKTSKEKTYESFVAFLDSKSVISPGEEYFRKALDLIESMRKREENFQEEKQEEVVEVSKSEHKETVPVKVDIILPVLEEPILKEDVKSELSVEVTKEVKETEEEKPKPRRRRRKKNQDES